MVSMVINAYKVRVSTICIPLCNDPIGLIQKGHLKTLFCVTQLTGISTNTELHTLKRILLRTGLYQR